MHLFILEISSKWNHTICGVWSLLLLSTIFPKFIHVVACVDAIVCWSLYNVPLYIDARFCSSICQLRDIGVISTFWLSWILRSQCMYTNLFFTIVFLFFSFPFFLKFFILRGIYLEVELLGHMVIPCLTYWGTVKLFFYGGYTISHSHQQC